MRVRGDLIGERPSDDPQSLLAAGLGVLGGAMAVVGTFLDWYTITIAGVNAPGGSATGWDGRDGRTVLAGAVVSLAAAVLVALDTRRLWPKIAMIVAGFVTGVIAVAGIIDTRGKAEQVRDEFAIGADRVAAEVGAGLWLVAGGAIVELAGGVAARQPAGTTFTRSLGRPGGGSAAATAR
jgi:hypothetical protein